MHAVSLLPDFLPANRVDQFISFEDRQELCFLNIFPKYTEFRCNSHNESIGATGVGTVAQEDYHGNIYMPVKTVQETTKAFLENCRISPRGKIVGFSRKSRVRFIKAVANCQKTLNVFQTLTYPDEVIFQFDTIEERAQYCSAHIHRFMMRVKRNLSEFSGYYRKEWEPRKSGSFYGQYCPHLHLLLNKEYLTESNYEEHCRNLAWHWVDSMNIDSRETRKKAMSVNQNQRSYDFLYDADAAGKYVGKYMAKIEDHTKPDSVEKEEAFSIGRVWGRINGIQEFEGLEVQLTWGQAVLYKRIMRQISRKKGRSFKDNAWLNNFQFINVKEIIKLLNYIINRYEKDYEIQEKEKYHQEAIRQGTGRIFAFPGLPAGR